jgi:hypothetical protein
MATIAAAAIAAGATLYATKQAGKRSKQEQQAAALMNQNSALAGQYGKDLLGKSQSALNPVYDYYSKLATGDRSELMRFLSPEIMARSQASRQAFQTGSELAPRSGMGTESVSRIPGDNSAFLSQLFQSARPAGIQGLGTLGTNWGSLGMSGLGQSTSGAGSILGYEQGRRADQRQAGMDAGASAYELFKLFQGMQGAGAGSGGGGTNTKGNSSTSFWNSAGKYGY